MCGWTLCIKMIITTGRYRNVKRINIKSAFEVPAKLYRAYNVDGGGV